MPATTDTADTTDTAPSTPSSTIAFRASASLDRALKALAQREGNPLSATVRRLVNLGLASERRPAKGGAR